MQRSTGTHRHLGSSRRRGIRVRPRFQVLDDAPPSRAGASGTRRGVRTRPEPSTWRAFRSTAEVAVGQQRSSKSFRAGCSSRRYRGRSRQVRSGRRSTRSCPGCRPQLESPAERLSPCSPHQGFPSGPVRVRVRTRATVLKHVQRQVEAPQRGEVMIDQQPGEGAPSGVPTRRASVRRNPVDWVDRGWLRRVRQRLRSLDSWLVANLRALGR